MFTGELPGGGGAPPGSCPHRQGRQRLQLQHLQLFSLSLFAIFSSCPSSPAKTGRGRWRPQLQSCEGDARVGVPSWRTPHRVLIVGGLAQGRAAAPLPRLPVTEL